MTLPDRPILLVGIGASAGGLEALRSLLGAVRESKGAAFVVVQHQEPSTGELLIELLESVAGIPVETARDGQPLRSECVYVCPPASVLKIEDGKLRVRPARTGDERRGPIDLLFESMADSGLETVGVLLSGAGSDGAMGLRRISAAGGMTIAQTPATAKFADMPRHAMEAALVDHVLPPARIAQEIADYLTHLGGRAVADPASTRQAIGEALDDIAELLRNETGTEVKHYKRSTLTRRVQRRMQVLRIDAVNRYVERLQERAEEREALFKELLVSVTEFFRDPEAFEALAQKAVPTLIERRSADEPVRVWVAGCSTGEEAYSLAILLREAVDGLEAPPPIQVFATDIDERALRVARSGAYPLAIADHVSPERLERFFVRRGNRYQVSKELRELVLFSVHDLIADPPFSRMDLISCRNVLIYLSASLQTKLIPVFHYALRAEGFLFLGPSETLTNHGDLFRGIDKRHRISQRKSTGAPRAPLPSRYRASTALAGAAPAPEPDIHAIGQRILLDEFAPRYAIVDEEGRVLALSEGAGRYLELGSGEFQNHVVRLARPPLRAVLRPMLAAATQTRRRQQNEDVSVRDEQGAHRRLRITVQPMPRIGEQEELFMIVFEDLGVLHDPGARAEGSLRIEQAGAVIEQLERELGTTRADLEHTIQDLEAANEELKSSNEELLSMNEELQSANEELETSKEEVQHAHDALQRAHANLENLLASTRIATIFLDEQHRIREFTPSSSEIYRVIPSDVGRPLTDLVALVSDMPPLPSLAELQREGLVEHEVRTAEGRWFTRRALPYRDPSGSQTGVVVTFVDVSKRKRAELRLATQHSVAHTIATAHDFDDALERVLSAFCQLLGFDACDLWRPSSDHEGELLLCAYASREGVEEFTEATRAARLQRGYGLPGRVWDADEPRWIPDLAADPEFVRAEAAHAAGLRSGVALPIRVEGQLVAVLAMYTRAPWEPDDELWRMLDTIGSELGHLLHRIRAEEGLARRNRTLETINRVNAALAGELDLERLVQLVTDAGTELSGARFGAFFRNVVDEDGGAYTLYAVSGVQREAFESFPMPRATPIFGPTFEGEGLVRLADVTQDPRYGQMAPHHGMPAGHPPVRSYLAAPVLARDGRVIGGLFFGHQEVGVFDLEAERVVGAIAHQAAIAIENAAQLQHIAESEQRLRLITDAVPILIGYVDKNLRYRFANAAYATYFGRQVVAGTAVAELLGDETFARLRPHLDRALSGRTVGFEDDLDFPAVGRRHCRVTYVPHRGARGEVLGIYVMAVDLSDMRRHQRQLEEATAAAEAANRAKSAFLANMSHEIRTPMTAILGYADVLTAHLSDPDDLSCVETIKRNGSYLLEIINDILDLSKIEAGKLEVKGEPVSPESLVLDVHSLMAVRAHERGLPLEVEFEGPLPKRIRTDATRLRQVLVNLIGNAIKFTAHGRVRLVVAFLADDEEPRLEFRVQDTGVGMSAEQQQRLFQPFTQADTSDARHFGGTGLGLTISKRLVEMLGGEIEVESTPGVGTTFRFTVDPGPLEGVPLVEPSAAPVKLDEPQPLSVRLDELSVLVVDDRRDIRNLLRSYLEERGAAVDTVADGRAALDRLRKAREAGRAYGAVILDMQMPVLDGFHAARTMRDEGYRGPIIAVTAAAMKGDRERCLEAGCDDYITKPVEARELIEAVERLRKVPLDRLAPRRRGAAAEPPAAASARRVLIVDDNDDAAAAIRLLLRQAGYEARVAGDGGSALAAALEFRPHAVLLDLGLPDMDGHEVRQRMAKCEELQGTRFIALSGRDEDPAQDASSGFHTYLLKPATVAQIRAAIDAEPGASAADGRES